MEQPDGSSPLPRRAWDPTADAETLAPIAVQSPPEGPDELFDPPASEWRRLSPHYITVRRISASIWIAVLFLPGAVAAWLATGWWWLGALVAVVGLGLWLWLWFRAARFVRSWGYAERDVDLCITRGLLFKRLTLVPFGRMQVVKVSSGPLLRAFGLATVELVTASVQTEATIPGLPAEEASALRDRLIELSDAEGSGL